MIEILMKNIEMVLKPEAQLQPTAEEEVAVAVVVMYNQIILRRKLQVSISIMFYLLR